MSFPHAVLWIDHRSARVLQFDNEHLEAQKVQAHTNDTGQHGSAVRTEHQFYSEVCDELAPIGQVVVAGSSTALSEFKPYVTKHRMPLIHKILGWETADHPTDLQLAAFARTYFKDMARLGQPGKPK